MLPCRETAVSAMLGGSSSSLPTLGRRRHVGQARTNGADSLGSLRRTHSSQSATPEVFNQAQTIASTLRARTVARSAASGRPPVTAPPRAASTFKVQLIQPTDVTHADACDKLLVYLPGTDGTGQAILPQIPALRSLGYDVWCLYLPSDDRSDWEQLSTQVTLLLRQLLQQWVGGHPTSAGGRSAPSAPSPRITIVAESFGCCLALRLAASGAGPELLDRLVLVNPATSFNRSLSGLSSLIAATNLLSMFPKDWYALAQTTLLPLLVDGGRVEEVNQRLLQSMILMEPPASSQSFGFGAARPPQPSTAGGGAAAASYPHSAAAAGAAAADNSAGSGSEPGTSGTGSGEAVDGGNGSLYYGPAAAASFRANLLRSGEPSGDVLRRVVTPVLLITSARDRLLPSILEGARLERALPNARRHILPDSGHAAMLERGFDLAAVMTAAGFAGKVVSVPSRQAAAAAGTGGNRGAGGAGPEARRGAEGSSRSKGARRAAAPAAPEPAAAPAAPEPAAAPRVLGLAASLNASADVSPAWEGNNGRSAAAAAAAAAGSAASANGAAAAAVATSQADADAAAATSRGLQDAWLSARRQAEGTTQAPGGGGGLATAVGDRGEASAAAAADVAAAGAGKSGTGGGGTSGAKSEEQAARAPADIDSAFDEWCQNLVPWRDVVSPVVRGFEHLPPPGSPAFSRPMLFVGNHQKMGFYDTPLLVYELYVRGYRVRGLAHPGHWSGPLGRWFESFGSVKASPMAAFRLLRSSEKVLLFPGGAKEVVKKRGQEYTLLWKDSPDFVRLAAKCNALIVPFAAVGADDAYDVIMDTDEVIAHPVLGPLTTGLLSRVSSALSPEESIFPITRLPVVGLPTPIPIPNLQRLYFQFSRPIDPRALQIDINDPQQVQELYDGVKGTVTQCMAELLEVRDADGESQLGARLAKSFQRLVPIFGGGASSSPPPPSE